MKREHSRISPPGWATRLLQWYCASHLLEEVQGDLEEEFEYQVNRHGIAKARIDYIRNVLGFIKPFAIKRKKSPYANSSSGMNMFNHYVTVAFRNVVRQKSFSAINVAGLALGMTCCLFIFLWVRDEKAMDNFHANGDRLFLLYQTVSGNGQTTGSYSTPFNVIFNLRKDSAATDALDELALAIPELEMTSAYMTGYELPWGHPETFQVGEKMQKFKGSRAGKDFFNMFSYPILAGNPDKALHDVSSMAISRSMAEYFFDSPEQAIGKSMRYENRLDFVVNAVYENVAPQSSWQFDFLLNWDAQLRTLDFPSHQIYTSFLLDGNADPKQVEVKLNQFLQRRVDPKAPEKVSLGLRPFGDQYLYGNFVNGKPREGRMLYVKIFTGVAIFILIIACINFMNLATARSLKRAREVGVRKVVGSSRSSLIRQFFGESILLSFVALSVSVILLQLLLPLFNDLTGKHITSPIFNPVYWYAALSLAFITGLIAGSYPALYLSSLKPVRILRGALTFTHSAVWFRKGLVCFQFALSILLLIATIVITSQTNFVQNTNLGYNRDNVVYIQIEGELNPKYALFKERALKMPGIAMVDRSTEAPHGMGFVVDEKDGFNETNTGDDAINWEGKKNVSVGFKPASVGYDFVNIMNLEIVEGRGFSKSFATDSADAFMVNEEALRQMGMTDPIGKWISAWNKKGHIIGVLKDYHVSSLREPIKPLLIDVKEYEYFGVIMLRLEQGKTAEGLSSIERVCKEINPNYPVAFQFMDEEYNKLYHSEQVVTKLTNTFAVLGFVISCLGLLGLAMFTAEQRTKEIGIRKVLGATIVSIVNLLSKDFIILVAIAFGVAAPVGGYFMSQWLQGFAYRIDMGWWIFAIAGITALSIALITISIQAIQSAITSPVKSLRSE
ncbi:permease prefix domain 2-containing transporter [Chryseolinea sp. T2]|uniref:permease prefix domain 2-containing transporter n=1 Tax=Chryseolinea sp. T2 TaxID=3129255 RepID=UPI0030781C34